MVPATIFFFPIGITQGFRSPTASRNSGNALQENKGKELFIF